MERGLSFLDEAKSKGFVLPVEVYNLALGRVNFVKEGFEQRVAMIKVSEHVSLSLTVLCTRYLPTSEIFSSVTSNYWLCYL